jgi:hypothetical protein
MHSSLGRLQPTEPATDEEMFRLEQRAWIQRGKGLVKVSEIQDQDVRQYMQQFFERKYGRSDQ